jgi:hypothetical protein
MLPVFRTASASTPYRVPAHSIDRLSGPKSTSELTPVERLINPCCFAKPLLVNGGGAYETSASTKAKRERDRTRNNQIHPR